MSITLHMYILSLVINAVLIVDMQQLVFDPADLQSGFFPSLMVQAIFFIKLSQAHHGFLTHTPLQSETRAGKQIRESSNCAKMRYS